jgi:hypothetical protein
VPFRGVDEHRNRAAGGIPFARTSVCAERRVAPYETEKADKGMTAPLCPHCRAGRGRWIEQPNLRQQIDHFICVICGHYWAAPLATKHANLPPFVLAVSGR